MKILKWIGIGLVARQLGQIAAPVTGHIIATRLQGDGSATEEAGKALLTTIARDDTVRQVQGRIRISKRAHEETARRPAGCAVVAHRAVQHVHHAVGDERRPTMPAHGGIPADGAVDDGDVAQAAQAAAHVRGDIVADGAALYRRGAVEE